MPFLDHFGLSEYPFGLTPNTKYYFPIPETDAVLAALSFAVSRGDGFIKVVGEVGTGKTLLCRMMLTKLAGMKVNTAYINTPALADGQVLSMVVQEFGVKVAKGDQLTALCDYLLKAHKRGEKNVLVIDEAQALGERGLELVRQLSNLETETSKLLQIVLFAQPELDTILAQENMRQIQQRINFSFTTRALTKDNVAAYVHHRLQSSGRSSGRGKNRKSLCCANFTADACRLLARASRGLPRLVHVIADKALMAAYARGVTTIDVAHVRAACRETESLPFLFRWFC